MPTFANPRSALVLSLGALVLAAGAAGPAAAAQRETVGRTGDRLIVIGRSLAATCYDHARLGRADRAALIDCDTALQQGATGEERIAVLVNRGLVRAARGDFEGAIADYDAAIASQPDLAEAHINAGRAYAALTRWDDAEAAFGRAIALWQEDDGSEVLRNLHFDRAIAREEIEDFAGAYDDYMRAAELDPEWDAPRRELQRFRVDAGDADGGGA